MKVESNASQNKKGLGSVVVVAAAVFLFGLISISCALFSADFWGVPSVERNKSTSSPNVSKSAFTLGTLSSCLSLLNGADGGWCELKVKSDRPGISNVWLDKQPKIQQTIGPRAVLIAWSSAAYDPMDKVLYFMGGGGMDYGGNEVYSFSLTSGEWRRLTDPSPLEYYSGDKSQYWIPDIRKVPPASYLSDGLVFNESTRTLVVLSTKAAVGARIRAKEQKPPIEKFLPGGEKFKQYEFNPSPSDSRNGMPPLSWRKIGDHSFRAPRTVQLADGNLLVGDKSDLYRASVTADGELKLGKSFAQYRRGRAGNAVFDQHRNWVWSIETDTLVAFDQHGKLVRELKMPFSSAKALAFDSLGRGVLWNGNEKIFWMDPDVDSEQWHVINWGTQGPVNGDSTRIYGKWVNIEDDVFVGISSSNQGIWVYKHPRSSASSRPLSNIDIQEIVNKSPDGASINLPPGLYGRGLRIAKALAIDMTGVELMGVSGGKGVLEIADPGGPVQISNFRVDAINNDARAGNLAGIRVSGVNFDVTLDRIEILNTAMGIMTDNRGGSLKITDSVIADIGTYKREGLSHIVYAGAIDKLIVRNSEFRRSIHLGHILKSRAKFTEIDNSLLLGLESNHSRVIDISCGGSLIVRNSVLQSSANSDNADMISVGVEPESNCKRGLIAGKVEISDSIIVFDRGAAANDPPDRGKLNRFFTWRVGMDGLAFDRNTIVSPGNEDIMDENVANISLFESGSNNRVFLSRAMAGLTPTINSAPQ